VAAGIGEQDHPVGVQFIHGIGKLVQGTLERLVKANVGDDMRELMNVEILVEDDKIVAIRA